MSFDKWFILVVIISAVNVTGRGLDAANSPVVFGIHKSLKGIKKKRPVEAALCKEAKEEGKSLRKGDARCSPGLRQDTRIEEVSILGRGLKSCLVLRASLFAAYISNSETKDFGAGMWNIGDEINILFSCICGRVQREAADFGVPELWRLKLLDMVSECQHYTSSCLSCVLVCSSIAFNLLRRAL
jgi:hypothetical protein